MLEKPDSPLAGIHCIPMPTLHATRPHARPACPSHPQEVEAVIQAAAQAAKSQQHPLDDDELELVEDGDACYASHTWLTGKLMQQ